MTQVQVPVRHCPTAVASAEPRQLDAASGVLGAGIVAMGLFAGVLYAFAVSVMPGLAHTDDRTFVDVMRRINTAIQNPVFFASFFGALIFTAIAALLLRRSRSRDAAKWTVYALGLYLLALAVTSAANVPFNDQLAKAGASGAITNLAAVRRHFETPWVVWNVVRTLACTAALGCLCRALLLHGRARRGGGPASVAGARPGMEAWRTPPPS
jgi:uncharacterized membrane protein